MTTTDVVTIAPSPSPRGVLAEAPAADRMAFLHEAAAVSGLRLPPTRIPEGESLLPSGEAKLRAFQGEIAALPRADEAHTILEKLETIQAAMDSVVPAASLQMAPHNAGLYGTDADPAKNDVNQTKALGYSRRALSHALALYDAPRNAVGVLTALSPKVRADAFNDLSRGKRPDGNVVIRSYKADGNRRSIRALTSERYAAVNDSVLTQALISACTDFDGGDARVRVTVEENATHIEAIFPMMARQIKVGDILWGRVLINNSHVKHVGIDVEGGVFRVLCYNLTTAYNEDEDAVSMRHIGDGRAIARRARMVIKAKLQQIAPFVVAFGDAYGDALPLPRAEMLEKVGKALEIPEHTLKLAAQLWDADGAQLTAGETRGGLVNALTRASQQLPYETAAVVERQAGRLVSEGWAALQ